MSVRSFIARFGGLGASGETPAGVLSLFDMVMLERRPANGLDQSFNGSWPQFINEYRHFESSTFDLLGGCLMCR